MTYTEINEFPVRTICGSMCYAATMQAVAEDQTSSGIIILMPFITDYSGGVPSDERKKMLDKMHFAKIDMSEAIIVVGSHIDESTTAEIEYAKKTGKDVIYHSPSWILSAPSLW